MFWNTTKKALLLRAEQAEVERDELRHNLSIREQQLAELQALYETVSEGNEKILESLNTTLTEYNALVQSLRIHNN